METVKKIDCCRLCKSKKLTQVLNFGKTPPANSFLKKDQLKGKEDFFPLAVNFCTACGQLQLSHVVSPKVLFTNYVYVSSTSPVFRKHFEEYARSVTKKFFLNNKSLVIDIGSNDGILLKPFREEGVKILGIEPAKNIAIRARKDSIPTIAEFFSIRLANKIANEHGRASIITANNVFAHIDDLDEVIAAVKLLLDEQGVFIIEAPYLVDFISKRYFDLVYHEHLSYLSLHPLQMFFHRLEMEIFDVKCVPVHGGSVRVFVKKKGARHKINKSVRETLEIEKKKGLRNIRTYYTFAKNIDKNRIELTSLLKKLKKNGKRIAGYGAPAKATTLLYYFDIGKETLDFIIDDSPFKQGLFTPGKHIPVIQSKNLYTKRPEYLLLLAWNFSDSIMKMHEKFHNEGGKFIIPVPVPTII